jgi:serine-type D-Ala-D-Ala carboxypeptidase (penicillin-binding protein 5/6)
VFKNSTGYFHPDQKVTARELAQLSIHLIETYPELYKLFAEKEFTWNKIRQQNRNPLLNDYGGTDGLKTGFLSESGYGLTASAVQDGQRLVLVVSGLKTARERAIESRKLLDYGFRAFEARQLFAEGDTVGEAQVYGGDRRFVPLVSPKPIRVLVPRGSRDRLTARIVYTGPLEAPVKKGTQVARVQVTRDDNQALEMPLYAGEDVGTGTITQRAWDGFLEFGTGLVRSAFSSVTN